MHKRYPEDDIGKSTPPKSDVNTVLSSAGNGVTIGIMPVLAADFYYDTLQNKALPRTLKIAGAFLAVTGCAIGAVVGMKEAKEINSYRQTLRDQLDALKEQGDENTRTIAALKNADNQNEKPATTHLHANQIEHEGKLESTQELALG